MNDPGKREEEKRREGLDLFRICAMLMITILHIVNYHYGLLNDKLPWVNHLYGTLWEYACLCGVNCFAILSGFLLCSKDTQHGKSLFCRIFSLYAKTVLWWILIYFVVFFLIPGSPTFSVKQLLLPFLPFRACWWYINAYLGLLIFLPIIVFFTSRSSSSTLLHTGIWLFIACSVMYKIGCRSEAFIHSGYSTIWLAVCFFLGAMLKKNIDIVYSWKHCRITALLTACFCILVPYAIFLITHKMVFLDYCSPFCVLEAISLLIFFYGIKISNSRTVKLISLVSVNSLGIYLFQCHSSIWSILFSSNTPAVLPLSTLLWRIPVWTLSLAVIGIILNWFIDHLFRLCRIPALGTWITTWKIWGSEKTKEID